MVCALRSRPVGLVVPAGRVVVALLFVRLLPLADLAAVGFLEVQVREDQVKDLRVPADGLAFYALLDVLRTGRVSDQHKL